MVEERFSPNRAVEKRTIYRKVSYRRLTTDRHPAQPRRASATPLPTRRTLPTPNTKDWISAPTNFGVASFIESCRSRRFEGSGDKSHVAEAAAVARRELRNVLAGYQRTDVRHLPADGRTDPRGDSAERESVKTTPRQP